jgi:uncharacterized protein DUF2283
VPGFNEKSRSEEVSPGIIVDYDKQDRVVGVERLNLSQRRRTQKFI